MFLNINNIKNILFSETFIPLTLFLASFTALISAYTAEYGFDLKPCMLCLYERIPYGLVLLISAIAVFYVGKKPKTAKILSMVCGLIMLFSFGLSAYHFGVEQRIFDDPSVCSAGEIEAGDIEALRASIFDRETIPCSEPAFEFLGVSMAGWNGLYSMGLVFFVFIGYWIQKKDFL